MTSCDVTLDPNPTYYTKSEWDARNTQPDECNKDFSFPRGTYTSDTYTARQKSDIKRAYEELCTLDKVILKCSKTNFVFSTSDRWSNTLFVREKSNVRKQYTIQFNDGTLSYNYNDKTFDIMSRPVWDGGQAFIKQVNTAKACLKLTLTYPMTKATYNRAKEVYDMLHRYSNPLEFYCDYEFIDFRCKVYKLSEIFSRHCRDYIPIATTPTPIDDILAQFVDDEPLPLTPVDSVWTPPEDPLTEHVKRVYIPVRNLPWFKHVDYMNSITDTLNYEKYVQYILESWKMSTSSHGLSKSPHAFELMLLRSHFERMMSATCESSLKTAISSFLNNIKGPRSDEEVANLIVAFDDINKTLRSEHEKAYQTILAEVPLSRFENYLCNPDIVLPMGELAPKPKQPPVDKPRATIRRGHFDEDLLAPTAVPTQIPTAVPVNQPTNEIIAFLTGYINTNQDTIIKVVEAAKAVQALLKPMTVSVTSSNVRNPAF